ncbi:response regulator transcription factor [Georgenia ruanii]|uniref:response regulator n=1 Tax=Georgenia ruanii TaxID=348442 RepID=UPI001D0277E5|nr:response regulator transcription factor [Georgenia ruanii]
MTIRVLVVDDHAVVREGLRVLLGTLDLTVVGVAEDGQAAVREAQLTRPDVVLMDIAMPGMGGVEATRAIHAACPDARVLMLTMFDDDATVLLAMRAGARGYVLKGADQDEIAAAIRSVAAGQLVFGPGIAARVLELFPAALPPREPDAFPELTAREREILEGLASGLRTAAIAAALHLSPKTVSNHLTSIFAKLEVTDRTEAMIRAREHGFGT